MTHEINLADLKGWGAVVAENLRKVCVIHDYFCELCDRPLVPLDRAPGFTNMHALVLEVMAHMRDTHPGTIPRRPGRT